MHSLLSSPPPKQLRTTSSLSTAFPSPSASFPPILVASSSTTLSERFRRAVIEDNLPLAKRLAAKAISISGGLSAGTTRRPSLVAGALGHGTSTASVAKKSALPSAPTLMLFPHAVSYSKAGHRAAVAQHAAASEPFDVRNVSAAAPAGSEERKTSLTIAVEHGASIEMVAWLLDMGHESEEPSRDADNDTILATAAMYNRADLIELYIERCPNLPIPSLLDWSNNSEGKTALHLAAMKGHDEPVRLLCDLGADIDLPDREGNTPLHYASSWGHLTSVQLLIERGCSFAVKNSAGFTAADFAYTHSVKAALEAFGRAQYDNRKRQRRAATNTASNSTEGSTGLAGPQGALGTRQSSNNLFAVAQGMPLPGTPTREQVPLPTTPQTPSWTTQGGHALHGTYTPANATQQQQLHRHYEGSESSASYASSSFEGRLRSGSGTSSAAEGSGRDWDPIKTFAQPGQPVPSPSPRPMANSQQVRNVFAEDGRRPSMGLPYRKAPSFDEAPWPGPGGTRSPPARPTQALPADTFGTSMSTSTSELSSIASKVRLRDQAAMNLFNRSRSPAPAPVPSPGPPASAGPPQASAGAYAVPTSAGPLKTAFFQNPQSQLSPPDGHGQGTHATPAHSRSLSAGAVVSSPTGAKLPPPPRTPPAHSNGSSALHSPGGSPKPPTPPPKS